MSRPAAQRESGPRPQSTRSEDHSLSLSAAPSQHRLAHREAGLRVPGNSATQ